MSIFYKKGCCSFAPELNLTDCCKAHDLAYDIGGGRKERKIADIEMRETMRKKGHRILCWVYFVCVRSFGWVVFNWKENEDA